MFDWVDRAVQERSRSPDEYDRSVSSSPVEPTCFSVGRGIGGGGINWAVMLSTPEAASVRGEPTPINPERLFARSHHYQLGEGADEEAVEANGCGSVSSPIPVELDAPGERDSPLSWREASIHEGEASIHEREASIMDGSSAGSSIHSTPNKATTAGERGSPLSWREASIMDGSSVHSTPTKATTPTPPPTPSWHMTARKAARPPLPTPADAVSRSRVPEATLTPSPQSGIESAGSGRVVAASGGRMADRQETPPCPPSTASTHSFQSRVEAGADGDASTYSVESPSSISPGLDALWPQSAARRAAEVAGMDSSCESTPAPLLHQVKQALGQASCYVCAQEPLS